MVKIKIAPYIVLSAFTVDAVRLKATDVTGKKTVLIRNITLKDEEGSANGVIINTNLGNIMLVNPSEELIQKLITANTSALGDSNLCIDITEGTPIKFYRKLNKLIKEYDENEKAIYFANGFPIFRKTKKIDHVLNDGLIQFWVNDNAAPMNGMGMGIGAPMPMNPFHNTMMDDDDEDWCLDDDDIDDSDWEDE